MVPKLMMLSRLMENSTGSSHAMAADMDRVRRWWHGGPAGLRRRALPLLFRAMAAAVALCSVTGMVALDRAAAYRVQIAGLFDLAAAACGAAGNDTVTSLFFVNEAIDMKADGNACVSVQSICEAVALVMASLSYLLLVLRNIAIHRFVVQNTCPIRPCCLWPTEPSAAA